MRTIYFLTDFSNAKERGVNISMQLRCRETDFDFKESIREESKDQVKNFVETWGGKITKKILEIAV